LGITVADRGTADCASIGKLTFAATVLVGIVADSIVDESTGVGIAACISLAVVRASTIALLVAFDDTVTTGLTGQKVNVAVVGETLRLDTVSPERRADVANRASREARDTLAGRGVHDEATIRVARARAEGTALLGADHIAVSARLRSTVVYGTISMTGFVGNDFPFSVRLDDYIGSGNLFTGLSSVLLGA
jgi:uncharacterized membrane protein YeaQ/YmgE (transglycosylase-associated protein family)